MPKSIAELVSVADFHLWCRCRRQFSAQWTRRGQDSGLSDPIRLHARREHERIRVVGQYSFSNTADAMCSVSETAKLAESKETHRNATFVVAPIAVTVDVMRWVPRQESYRAMLFRPATGVRGSFLDEAALVLLALRHAEIPTSAIELYFLNKSYRREGDLNRHELFKESNLTNRAAKRIPTLEQEIQDLQGFLAGAPVDSDYVCRQKCERCVPRPPQDLHSIFTLHKGADLARELSKTGVLDVRQIPATVPLSRKQLIQLQAIETGNIQLDCPRLHTFLYSLRHPLHFLDFEAFAPAIPPAPGLSPYEHTPVLASLHVCESELHVSDHGIFTVRPGRDDRVEFFSWLQAGLGTSGSVVVFSAPFEAAMIRQLAVTAGAESEGETMVSRLVDLYKPFREFAVYHPQQMGKVSLKRVLPVFTDSGYEELAVNDGMQANLDFTRHADIVIGREDSVDGIAARAAEGVVGSGVPAPASLQEIGDYCTMDTRAMIDLLGALFRLRHERCS